jgi:hypothetical protein
MATNTMDAIKKMLAQIDPQTSLFVCRDGCVAERENGERRESVQGKGG